MNIFYLDHSPAKAAQAHYDCHVRKMILESAQLLSTAWHVLLPQYAAGLSIYRQTHVNHPSARWVRESGLHYSWLWDLGMALCGEFQYRWGKPHATEQVLRRLSPIPVPVSPVWKDPPQAMPCMYQHEDAVTAYRMYYKFGKAELLKYTKREQPEWMDSLDWDIHWHEIPVRDRT